MSIDHGINPGTTTPAASKDTVPGILLGSVSNIWTYPVKALRAVEHETSAVEEDGLAGDRRAALVVTSQAHARSGKTYRGKENHRLHLTHDPIEAKHFAAERAVEVEMHGGQRFFDVRPVSLIFDTWLAEAERLCARSLDPLRYRPNVFARVEPMIELGDERSMIGKRLAIGGCKFEVVAAILRCVTPSYDVDSGDADPTVQRAVVRHRDNIMGIYCEVVRTGSMKRGDPITLT